ncbi:hypothetical protein C8R44DRAFT_739924 [Mycena epipterygia]|nr:hypothetical protein C8R44DRAFT_739924 [Mycena epipterygia]
MALLSLTLVSVPPTPRPSLPLVQRTSTGKSITSWSPSGPGKTLHEIYSTLGLSAEKYANRAAHTLGLGPRAVAHRIQAFFGDGYERESKLNLFGDHHFRRLEKDCLRLMEYALPSESARTQLQTFKTLVALITRYPGLWRLFRNSKHIQPVENSEVAISCLWDRAGDPCSSQWGFYRDFASGCVADNDISSIVGNYPMSDFSGGQGGLTVIERLLIAADSQYLGGILELPSFWIQTGSIYEAVIKKLFSTLAVLLKDIGVDSMDVSDSVYTMKSDPEGLDILSEAVLAGLKGWTLGKPPAGYTSHFWYSEAWQVLQLLRQPKAEHLLPRSWRQATSESFYQIVPPKYITRDMDTVLATNMAPDIGGLESESPAGSRDSLASHFVPLPLLPADLPHTQITVSHIHVWSRRGKQDVFIGLYIDPGNKEGWKIEKTYSDLYALDRGVKRSAGSSIDCKTLSLPGSKLLKGCVPRDREQTKACLQSYFQALINLPNNWRKEVIGFLTSNVLPENATSHQKERKEGYLVKRKSGGFKTGYTWKMRYVVVDGPLLKYYASPGGRLKRSIDLTGAWVGHQRPEPQSDKDYEHRHAFLVSSPQNGSHVFCADNEEDKGQWVQLLASYVSGSYRDTGDFCSGRSDFLGSEIYWNLTMKDEDSNRAHLSHKSYYE